MLTFTLSDLADAFIQMSDLLCFDDQYDLPGFVLIHYDHDYRMTN